MACLPFLGMLLNKIQNGIQPYRNDTQDHDGHQHPCQFEVWEP